MTTMKTINFNISKYKPFHQQCILCLILYSLLTLSCKDFIDVGPPKDKLVSENVYTNDGTATASILGIYSKMMTQPGLFSFNTTFLPGLSADEFTTSSSTLFVSEFLDNDLSVTNSYVQGLWGDAYSYIYASNIAIRDLDHSSDVTAPVKTQLIGEAKFIRAFCYFYLVNYFESVPLILNTDYKVNASAKQTGKGEVYHQIIADLKDAQNNLGRGYVNGSNAASSDRVRPNKYAALALLSRVYLYQKDWDNAALASTEILNNTGQYQLADIAGVFLKNSPEAIWQLQPVRPMENTLDGLSFILMTIPGGVYAPSLKTSLVNEFIVGDKRRSQWIGSITIAGTTYYYPYKYRASINTSVTEHYTVLRLAEQLLIRAEARAHLNDLPASLADINRIRKRAGLIDINLNNQSDVLNAIYLERRLELFAEFGHRWFDLKRTNLADEVLIQLKPNWKSTAAIYPIPQSEIQNNSNLIQNAGY
jgi:hypothetical protein